MMPVCVALLLPVLGCGGQDPARAQDPTNPKPAASAQDPTTPPPPEQGKPVNRLAKETSPYLRLHQHNPVDWYPWGEEALALAKAEDKPIFLSIGYSACHWCHVMERESFEDPEIAALMNELFVCIKVDREERPDIDELYMAATQAMTGAGGWPMSVWLTPDLVPFYAGTYFPPHRSLGRPGFKQVIEELAKAFRERREQVDATAEQIREHLALRLAPEARPGEPSLAFGAAIVVSAAERFDPEHGGFGQVRQQGAPPSFAPKFPHASELGVLLREAARTGDAKALSMAEQTLEHMARGGMYDQLAGGFHRYSTDREWLVPHFEKMLYDNALLARTYCEAYAQTGKPFYARVARQTLDYMIREMQDPRGGFYSTTDAQSEGVEGKYFVWKGAEFDAACGDDAAVARRHWGVTDDGNWEHVNVLHWAASPAQIAAAMDRPVAEVEAAIERARTRLLAVRGQRIPPPLDDKVLTAWNGMAIAAMAVGHQVLGDERYLQSAQRAAGFVLSELRRDGRLLRTWRDVEGVAEAKLAGYLEDYGFLADGLLCLGASDGDARWLEATRELLEVVRDQFADPVDGNFFFTANDHEQLLARSKSVIESSTPSGIAMVVQSLLRAGLMLGEPALEEAAEAALRANFDMLDRHPIGCPSLVQAVQFHLGDPREVVVAGAVDDPRTAAMLDVARRHFPPHVVVLHVHDGNRTALGAVTPLVHGKEPVDGAPAAYVCRRGVCEAPVTDAAALGAALGR